MPQVIVTVDGLPAVCKNLTCDFTYIESPYEITSFSIDENEEILTLEGVSLPEDILSISFTNVACEDITFDQQTESTTTNTTDDEGNEVTEEVVTVISTTITCTMSDILTAGSFYPVITDEFGIIPVADDVEAFVKEISIDSITVSDTINMMGGDTATIYGSGFPSSLDDGSDFSVTLSSGTPCAIESVNSTKLSCRFSRIPDENLGANLTLTISLNGLTDESLGVTAASFYNTAGGIEPVSYSPVLKTNLTISMDENFDSELNVDDLYVNLID